MDINTAYRAWQDLNTENKINIVKEALEESNKLGHPVYIHFSYDSENNRGYFIINIHKSSLSFKIDYIDAFDLKMSYKELFGKYVNKINHLNSLNLYAQKMGFKDFSELFLYKAAEKIAERITNWLIQSTIYYNMSVKEHGADF